MDPLAILPICLGLALILGTMAFLLGYDARGRDDNAKINDLVRGFEQLAREIRDDPGQAGYRIGQETVLDQLEAFTARLRRRNSP